MEGFSVEKQLCHPLTEKHLFDDVELACGTPGTCWKNPRRKKTPSQLTVLNAQTWHSLRANVTPKLSALRLALFSASLWGGAGRCQVLSLTHGGNSGSPSDPSGSTFGEKRGCHRARSRAGSDLACLLCAPHTRSCTRRFTSIPSTRHIFTGCHTSQA